MKLLLLIFVAFCVPVPASASDWLETSDAPPKSFDRKSDSGLSTAVIDAYLNDAESQLKKRDYPNALELLNLAERGEKQLSSVDSRHARITRMWTEYYEGIGDKANYEAKMRRLTFGVDRSFDTDIVTGMRRDKSFSEDKIRVGDELFDNGKYEAAETSYRASRAVSELYLIVVDRLTRVYCKTGRTELAEEKLGTRLKMISARLDGDVSNRELQLTSAYTMCDLALVYVNEHRLTEAAALFRQNLPVIEKLFDHGPPQISSVFQDYALLLLAQGDANSSVEAYQKAIRFGTSRTRQITKLQQHDLMANYSIALKSLGRDSESDAWARKATTVGNQD